MFDFNKPNIEITANEKPKKFEPVSPKNVFAGVKLNGKNPTNAPANAVISTIDINDEPFNTNITNNEIADIIDIPDDSPSSPSIKFIAFVTIIIHANVISIDVISCISGKFKNGNDIPSILIPDATMHIDPNSCPINFVIGFIVFVSSTTQKAEIINIPPKNPNSFSQYFCIPNKFIEFSILITINIYIVDTKNPKITAGPPNFGIDLLCALLSSFGISIAPIFFAIFIVYGVVTNVTTNASINAIAMFPHIYIPPIISYYFFLFLLPFLVFLHIFRL